MVNGFQRASTLGALNSFSKTSVYCIYYPLQQTREILFEGTGTCVWLKLDVCSMCVRFETQTRTKCLNQAKYFAKANSTFTIFLHWRHDRLTVYQLKTFPCFGIVILRSQSVYHLCRPYLSPSRLFLPWPDSIALNVRIKRARSPSTANCSDSTSHKDDALLDNLSSEDFFHWTKPPKRRLSER